MKKYNKLDNRLFLTGLTVFGWLAMANVTSLNAAETNASHPLKACPQATCPVCGTQFDVELQNPDIAMVEDQKSVDYSTGFSGITLETSRSSIMWPGWTLARNSGLFALGDSPSR